MLINNIEAPGFTNNLKEKVRSWGINSATDIQVKSLAAGVADGANLVVSAPTSSGKTLIGEIAALSVLSKGGRCIYLVTHKALADQKYADFEERFGSSSDNYIASVGLSTGDGDKGDITPQLLVATYEKALAMLLSDQINPNGALIVADELQIIGEDGRGPNIEALCSVIRQKEVTQFIALTATVGNPEELAYWLRCEPVVSHIRDVELYQEIWSGGSAYSVRFGDDDGQLVENLGDIPSNELDVVNKLIEMGRGPVLVFTESKNEAQNYANIYSEKQTQTVKGIEISEQLDLFSEPTEISEQLQGSAQKQVAFHTSDLTAQERHVIEEGFSESQFNVCFATSTLAAGVNYPFQTVVFPKLTYQWGEREGQHINRSDYRNMSGRAGRLGMHECGYAILLPKSSAELAYSNQIILPENDRIKSHLVNLSMRKSILMLVSSKIIDSANNVRNFFENTYFWYQISEHNPDKLDEIIATANESVNWLIDNNLIVREGDMLAPTVVGKAIAETGLLPTTAISFLEMIRGNSKEIERDFDSHIVGIIHWVCSSEEFRGRTPSRFLVYPSGRRHVSSHNFLLSQKNLRRIDPTDQQLNQCAHAIALYCNGDPERQIRYHTNIPSGGVHRLAIDVAWVLDGLQRIASVPELGYSQILTNSLSMLSRRVHWGTPSEALDLIRVAQGSNVPGFGRQRALALISQGLTTFDEILSTAKDKLVALLRNENRTDALLNAISQTMVFQNERYEKVHIKVAESLGLSELVKTCNTELGTKYEDAIKGLLEVELGWVVRVLDDGKAQNEPDLLLTLGDKAVIVECKTTIKNPPLIKKEEAWAVLQKAADYDGSMHRLTLGKPGFDELSKKKVLGARDISLIEHSAFIEGLLRVHTGSVTPDEFVDWLMKPGLIELCRLGGKQTYEIARG